MVSRQRSWPRQWLMTDERMGERLWSILEGSPGETGVVVRHYSASSAERAAIAHRVAGICRKRQMTFAIAADEDLALALGAQLVHNPTARPGALPFSLSVHSNQEAIAAREAGASLVFVSPVYETRSHPGRKALGITAAIELAKAAGVPAIALGGMDARRFEPLEHKGFYGWAGIDAWAQGPD